MTDTVTASLPLRRWQGDRGTYHLVIFAGEQAEHIAAHALMQRLELGHRRGFGSVKVIARIGETEWKTSVFPIKIGNMSQRTKNWTLLVSKKVMRAEDLAEGDPVAVAITLL